MGVQLTTLALAAGVLFTPTLETFHPSSTIVITVTDYSSNPVEGLIVVALGKPDAHYMSSPSSYPLPLPKTDSAGKVIFENVSPGAYAYRIREPLRVKNNVTVMLPKQAPFVTFKVEPGQTYERTVRVGAAPEGTAERLLQEWTTQRSNRRAPEVGTNVPSLSADMREKLAALIISQLDELPSLYYPTELGDVGNLATAAEHFWLPQTVPSIQDAIMRWVTWESTALLGVVHAPIHTVTRAVATLAGDEAVDFFSAAAENPDLSYDIRIASILSLGQIGSQRSVKAFLNLKVSALGKQGVPEPTREKTDAEKMAETIDTGFNTIAMKGAKTLPPRTSVFPGTEIVSEDGATGSICGSVQGQGSTRILMKRFADDWLIVGFGTTIIS